MIQTLKPQDVPPMAADEGADAVPLVETLAESGRWLFRWRSYLPLVMIACVLASLDHYSYPFGSHWLDLGWEAICLLVGVMGLVIRGLVAGYVPRHTSGRNTRGQVADSLNTTGMYSIVRNPLYLGNYVMTLGVALFLHTLWLPLVYTLAFALYYERIIIAEESFLRRQFGKAYSEWAHRTPVILPRFSAWRPAALPFSWRTAIRREYQSAYGLVMALFAMELVSELWVTRRLAIDPAWAWLVGVATAAYLVIRVIHKRGRYLYVDGR